MRHVLAVGLMLAPLALTAAASSNSANDASALTQVRPVSTGVTGPQLAYSAKIEIPASEISDAFPNPARVILNVNLDATGSPTAIQVLQPITQAVDERVIAAVKQFRWRPAVLDNQTIPAEVKLVVEVQR
jgi:TonB family protein